MCDITSDPSMYAEAAAAVAAKERRCGRVTGYSTRFDGFGARPITCHVQRGLRSWTDGSGVQRFACARHYSAMVRRYPA